MDGNWMGLKFEVKDACQMLRPDSYCNIKNKDLTPTPLTPTPKTRRLKEAASSIDL
jgi:hypothetical protein